MHFALVMELSQTLHSPLNRYVDAYFNSKISDLVTAFGLPETDVRNVLERGVGAIKPAPIRRASVDTPPPAKVVVPEPTKLCQHVIKGKTERVCGKTAKQALQHNWYCTKHWKMYNNRLTKKPTARPSSSKSLARKVWNKQPFEKQFKVVQEGERYFDATTRICFCPNTKEALGVVDDVDVNAPLLPFQEKHLELLASANIKKREASSALTFACSDSDSDSDSDNNEKEELVLLDEPA